MAEHLHRLQGSRVFVAGHRGLVGSAIVRRLETLGCRNVLVRSRSERGGSAQELTSFAERARLQAGVATALSDGLLALMGSVLASAADGTLRSVPGRGAETRTELMIYGDGAATVLSDIERLASLIGVSVEQQGERVILRVLPEGKSHSKD